MLANCEAKEQGPEGVGLAYYELEWKNGASQFGANDAGVTLFASATFRLVCFSKLLLGFKPITGVAFFALVVGLGA